MNKFKWFVINTSYGKEFKVLRDILNSVKLNKLEGYFANITLLKKIKNPLLAVNVQQHWYSGYILIRLNELRFIKNFLSNIPGVFQISPQAIDINPSDFINLNYSQLNSGENNIFKLESSVVIVHGPFINLKGIIKELYPDRNKAKVLVSIFGRLTPLELDYRQISLIKNNF